MNSTLVLLINIISAGSLYSLYALGIALVFSILRLLNFAHGAFIVVGGYTLVLAGGIPFLFRIALVLLVTVIAALATERAAFRPLRGASDETLLITSFAVSYFIQSLVSTIFSPVPRSSNVATFFGTEIHVGTLVIPTVDVVTIALTAILVGSLSILLQRTPLGLQLRAAAEDFTTARLLGVPAARVVLSAFVITGVLAAAASIMLVARDGVVTPDIGTVPVLLAFVAVIVGGLGSLWAAVSGAFMLAAIETLLETYLSPGLRPYTQALTYTLIIAVLVVRPRGLFVLDRAGQRV